MEQVETCDLCGSSLASAARVPGLEELGLVECRECGLVITTPRPSREEIGTFYPDTYYAHVPGEPRGWQRVAGKVKAYRGGYPTTDGAVARALWATAARVLRGVFLTQLPYRGGGRRLLDVGCGVGDALRWAVDHGWEGYGVEPDPEAVAIARARGLTRVAVGELRDQRYPDAFFDAITLYQALEHMHSPSRELAECRRILAPGGALYVSVPNFDSFPRRLLGERWYALQLPIHLYHFTPRTLSSLAGKAGFRVARRRDYSRLVSTLTTLKSLRSAAGAPPAAGTDPAALADASRSRGNERHPAAGARADGPGAPPARPAPLKRASPPPASPGRLPPARFPAIIHVCLPPGDTPVRADELTELLCRVIDFHNHLLAAVDDGASDPGQSRDAIRAMHEQGVRAVVVTPHLLGSVTERPEALAEALGLLEPAYAEFSAMVAGEFPGLQVHRGVELMLDSPSVDLADPRVRLAGTSFVLVEFPGMTVPPHSVQALYRLRVHGWRPVVAHPERYHNLDDLDVVEEWRSVGAFLQCNAGSVVGRYGSRAEEMAWDLLARGWADYLCSDYHARGRLPLDACRDAFAEAGGQESFEQLTRINPGRMLEGEEPLPVRPLERRRSLWQRLRRGRA